VGFVHAEDRLLHGIEHGAAPLPGGFDVGALAELVPGTDDEEPQVWVDAGLQSLAHAAELLGRRAGPHQGAITVPRPGIPAGGHGWDQWEDRLLGRLPPEGLDRLSDRGVRRLTSPRLHPLIGVAVTGHCIESRVAQALEHGGHGRLDAREEQAAPRGRRVAHGREHLPSAFHPEAVDDPVRPRDDEDPASIRGPQVVGLAEVALAEGSHKLEHVLLGVLGSPRLLVAPHQGEVHALT